MIFLDWSQYGAPGWTKACPGVDLSDLIGGWSGSKVVELLELQTLYLIGREERTLSLRAAEVTFRIGRFWRFWLG